MATFCSPICAYRACISCYFPCATSLSNTTEDFDKNSFFQVFICVGCTSYFFASASMVCCSLTASIHTLLLHSAENILRLVLLILTGLMFTNFDLIHLSEKPRVLYFLADRIVLCALIVLIVFQNRDDGIFLSRMAQFVIIMKQCTKPFAIHWVGQYNKALSKKG